ncbi:MAG TPA: EAL domain-containing protein [Acidimicrobiales bacterium]|nr:EAL domain-containing protein [Acidimicrobiales bacterium]
MGSESRAELVKALENGELVLHYQPKILLANDRVAGAEALVRWQHPTRGLIPPDLFIPLAEDTGLIVPLGAWALEEGCRQAQAFQARFPYRPPLVMSVNLSARQFEPELVATVAGILDRTGIQPWRLCLELTESIIMTDVESAIDILAQLKALGVWLSIDDFGTGYSSLAYLRRFPIDELKIDRSFVDGLGREAEDTAIVAAVVAMAHALGLSVVAEGVETQEQLERLRILGCEQVQGYYFSPAMPAAGFQGYLDEEDRRSRSGGMGYGEPGGYQRNVVIIADDSPEVLQLASVSLSAAGFEVHESLDGRAALDLAQAIRPTCVILDVRMPEMDGIAACKALRADPNLTGCTIIMLTSNADALDKIDGFSAGADDYIVKPFAPRDLVSRVRVAIRRHQGGIDWPAEAMPRTT